VAGNNNSYGKQKEFIIKKMYKVPSNEQMAAAAAAAATSQTTGIPLSAKI
jgi:hypothetical protein